ncbi:MAG: hypothetical protein FJ279_14720 [Planctomycetes bacterium]|nr:hypothetical protein [Planctomycetota bacterium]MBM4081366.1 hypothetical protein [Planctomycetota bacterium]
MSLKSVFAKGMGLSAAAAGLLLTLTVGGCHSQVHRKGVSFGFSDTPDGFRSSFEMPEERERRIEAIPSERKARVKPKIGEATVIDESEEKPPKTEKSEPSRESEPEVDDEGAPVERPKKGEPPKAPRR